MCKKLFSICHKSGTLHEQTDKESVAQNRANFGWVVVNNLTNQIVVPSEDNLISNSPETYKISNKEVIQSPDSLDNL